MISLPFPGDHESLRDDERETAVLRQYQATTPTKQAQDNAPLTVLADSWLSIKQRIRLLPPGRDPQVTTFIISIFASNYCLYRFRISPILWQFCRARSNPDLYCMLSSISTTVKRKVATILCPFMA